MTEAPVADLGDLVRRATDGDERAWGALVDRFAPLRWSVCRGFRLSPADAEDVVQAVWLRTLEHLAAVREPAALPGWLVTTTRRECLRQLRRDGARAGREAPLLEHAAVDTGPAPDDVADVLLRAERQDALRAAFAGLGERCRALLALLTREPPVPYSRISAELGIAVGSIGPIRGRCLERLRRDPAVAALLARPATLTEATGG